MTVQGATALIAASLSQMRGHSLDQAIQEVRANRDSPEYKQIEIAILRDVWAHPELNPYQLSYWTAALLRD